MEAVRKDGVSAWKCACACGNTHVVKNADLRNTASCGCLRIDLGKAKTRHGMHGSKIYEAWHAMKQRCTNPKHKAYKNYGGRGITVCEEWIEFDNFMRDMYPRPEGSSLERINNSKGYSKDNCKWATPKEQANNTRSNRRISIFGKEITLTEASSISGLSVQTLSWRLGKLKMTPEEAMTTPLMRAPDKGGVQDLQKAQHYLEKLLEVSGDH